MLDSWADANNDDIINPTWNYDNFTQYCTFNKLNSNYLFQVKYNKWELSAISMIFICVMNLINLWQLCY